DTQSSLCRQNAAQASIRLLTHREKLAQIEIHARGQWIGFAERIVSHIMREASVCLIDLDQRQNEPLRTVQRSVEFIIREGDGLCTGASPFHLDEAQPSGLSVAALDVVADVL